MSENILEELQTVFKQFFKNDLIILKNETVADDIEYWDSLTHIELINTIEKQFNITFTFNEVLSFETVGEMIICIQNHLQG
jgi:acyl carrier protein